MTHDQIRQMVRRINPVPDPSVLEILDASVLEVERSKEMQVEDRPATAVRKQERWRGPLIGIAALAAILVAGLLWRNTVAPVATPALDATPLATIELDQPIAPGAYFADADNGGTSSVGGTFIIEGDGWTSIQSHGARKGIDPNYVSLMIVEIAEVYTDVCDAGQDPVPAGSTPEALADQFAFNGFTLRERLTPVSAFGHEGLKLVMDVPPGCAGEEFQAWNGGLFGGRYYQASGQVVEYWFLDVEGAPVMVEASWFPSSPEEDVTELREVLDTLVITP